MALIEIDGFPINSMVIVYSYVKLPEGRIIITHPILDGLYHPFMVNLGMV